MLLVPGDFFAMGVPPEVLADECSIFGRTCDETLLAPAGPQHPAYVDSFYIDAYEVTNAAYVTFLNDTGEPQAACQNVPCLLLDHSRIGQVDGRYVVESGFSRHPVTGTTWYGAALFCAWRGARLPTEAEWEMGASWEADTSSKTLYPWGNDFQDNAANSCDVNCTQAQAIGIYDDGYAETAPVGSFPRGRSAVGAYDMAGNVWEWVADWFGRDYYAQAPQENPQGPSSGSGRVLRGGSWFDTGNFTATVFRSGLPPDQSNDAIGFRCALETGPRSSE